MYLDKILVIIITTISELYLLNDINQFLTLVMVLAL